ncbi:hypothetical protein BU14_3086s0001 [Porphyra umbilicalis]|uniref:Uncharacterized protein n=1 Tax=Porphyra umbilicalis TaxID=2786 RepID=A0A1X6NIA3_PORUM|nr:hypothetical protein BU14_3086s0001 [Porphyra umbilicalis]|eukprot:OSX68282.1 hypothetical protein BU14_3086s0001 [Porphyra umbilicalis]
MPECQKPTSPSSLKCPRHTIRWSPRAMVGGGHAARHKHKRGAPTGRRRRRRPRSRRPAGRDTRAPPLLRSASYAAAPNGCGCDVAARRRVGRLGGDAGAGTHRVGGDRVDAVRVTGRTRGPPLDLRRPARPPARSRVEAGRRADILERSRSTMPIFAFQVLLNSIAGYPLTSAVRPTRAPTTAI